MNCRKKIYQQKQKKLRKYHNKRWRKDVKYIIILTELGVTNVIDLIILRKTANNKAWWTDLNMYRNVTIDSNGTALDKNCPYYNSM